MLFVDLGIGYDINRICIEAVQSGARCSRSGFGGAGVVASKGVEGPEDIDKS